MVNQYGQFVPDYPGQQYYQDPNYMRFMAQHQQAQQPQQNSRMVEVVPAESLRAAEEFPVGAGQTRIILANDDSFVCVKAVDMTGAVSMTVFDRRPPEKKPEPLNPQDYVRRDEIQGMIAEAIRESRAGRRAAKEAEE